MKKLAIAVLTLIFSVIAPLAGADEAKAPNAATVGATAPAASILDKTVGKWGGPFTRPASNYYFTYNMGFDVRKEGDKFIGTLKSPNVDKEPTAELKVVDERIVGDFSYDNVLLILTLRFKDDGSMAGELSVGKRGTTPPYDLRTGEFMRKM